VTTGLRDVLARCQCVDPAARYPSAALVAEDLRRHLTNRPLLGVRNRSFAERCRKWYHRRPQALLVGLLLTACLGAVAAFPLVYAREVFRRLQEAKESLAQGQRLAEQRHYAEAVGTLDRGLEQLGDTLGGDSLRTDLHHCRQRAARAHDIQALHAQVEHSRYLHDDELLKPATVTALETHCRAVWQQRDRLLPGAAEPLEADMEEMLRRDLLDVSVLWSHCRVRLAPPGQATVARREALAILREAEILLGPSPVLSRERGALAPTVGPPGKVEAGPAPRTAWEHYTLGRSLLRSGDLAGAAEAFDRAVALRPQDFWPWFGKGLCAQRRQRPDEAVTAFSVCVALTPECAACYHNRARALADRGDVAAALGDYDRALKLDPSLAAAALNRGALQLEERRFAEAEADFRLALQLGANAAAGHYNMALLHQARHEPAAALACLEQALRHDPGHRPSRDLQARLKKQASVPGPEPRDRRRDEQGN
jgi:tetratricopeptide (TPR) repeat protein